MNKAIGLLMAALITISATAQVLTLEECRQLAMQHNKKIEMDREAVAAAQDTKRGAISNFFPKFSANGTYMYNRADIHLIPTEYQMKYGIVNKDGNFNWQKDIFHPQTEIGKQIQKDLQQGIGSIIGEQYGKLYENLSIDLTHTLIGQVGVTQPIFVGGKLVQAYKIAQSTENISRMKQQYDENDLTYRVDEAYWRVLSVQKKKALAQQYYDLLMKLTGDVTALVEEGVATQADLLKVTMKRCEAEEKLGQATDGLILSKMALCQLIGKDLNYDIRVEEQELDKMQIHATVSTDQPDVTARDEVKMLEEAKKIAHADKMLAASTLMPNIVASANYMMTNKSLKDGFDSNKYYGWVNAGVVVNIPIAHANDIYKVKSAKHREKMADLAVEEVREMLELQATQSLQKVSAAQRKLLRTKAAAENAKEVLRMAEEGFEAGVISSSDLMGAQTQWQSAESDRIDAAIELQLAELNYKKNTGKKL